MEKFSIKKRLQSFKYAFNGLKIMFRNEHNAWIHSVAALVVIGAGCWFGISKNEWYLIVLVIALVLLTEAINTAIEHLANAVTPEKNVHIGKAKDVAAGAVLLAAIAAAIVGLMIFIPHLLERFNL